MATAILDLILKSPLGKSIFTWFFIAMGAAIAFLGWYAHKQSNDIKDLNKERNADQKHYTKELSKCDSLRVEDYKYFYNEINKEKQRRQNWKK